MHKRLAGFAVLCALALAGPTGAAAATISGTVSSETTHAGIVGVEVCPTPQPYTFETECAETDSAGHYELPDLPAASYHVYFSTERNNLRYVGEFYDNEAYSWEADLFALGSEDRSLNVELAEGGSIGGAVADETTGLPIEGIRACALDAEGIPIRCSVSDGSGDYTLNGLRSGEYSVEFEGASRVNYQREFYADAESWAQATPVTVTAPNASPPVDAELARGAEILGHVSEVSSGAPVVDALVCAPPPAEESFDVNCDATDAAGNFAIRGLRAGTYQVAFEVAVGPFGPNAFEWWQGVGTRTTATPLVLSTPSTTTGIDGRASRPDYQPATAPEVAAGPVVPVIRQASGPKPPVRCRKGFHRRLVKGKRRCVREKHRHHHRRPR